MNNHKNKNKNKNKRLGRLECALFQRRSGLKMLIFNDFHEFLTPLVMDFFENEGIGLKMLVCAGSSQLLSQLGRAIDRNF